VVELDGEKLKVTSRASAGSFVEWIDLRTGRHVGRKRTDGWLHPDEVKAEEGLVEIRTAEFGARDGAGNGYRLGVWTRYGATPADGSRPPEEGVKYRTADGRIVNRLAKGEYEIADSGTRLHSDDRDAP